MGGRRRRSLSLLSLCLASFFGVVAVAEEEDGPSGDRDGQVLDEVAKRTPLTVSRLDLVADDRVAGDGVSRRNRSAAYLPPGLQADLLEEEEEGALRNVGGVALHRVRRGGGFRPYKTGKVRFIYL